MDEGASVSSCRFGGILVERRQITCRYFSLKSGASAVAMQDLRTITEALGSHEGQ